MCLKNNLKVLIVSALLIFSFSANSQDFVCKSANLLGPKLITDICWRCIFPMKLAGATMNPFNATKEDPGEISSRSSDGWANGENSNWMEGIQDWVGKGVSTLFGSGEEVPDGASNQSVCMCQDQLGVPRPGLVTAFWEPYRLIEFQTIPGCLAALNGTRLNINPMNLGSHGTTPTGSPDQAAFNHYHYYVFPLVHMLELFSGKGCNPGGYSDFDLLYISELDPTWSNGEISYFANPEAALFANPAALASCIPDALSSTVNKPLEPLFWCAGTWGLVYPLTGRINERLGILRRTSLGAVRVMTQIHRRGFAWATMGDDALCNGYIAPYFPKTQYKFTMAHPVADTQRSHKVGAMVEAWGPGKVIPVAGEQPIYLIWRWLDCCNRF